MRQQDDQAAVDLGLPCLVHRPGMEVPITKGAGRAIGHGLEG